MSSIIGVVARHDQWYARGPTNQIAGCAESNADPGLDWSELTQRFLPDLVDLGRRKFGLSDEDSRELAQEVIAGWLLRADRHRTELGCRSEEHLFAILCQTLTRRWIDHLRRAARNEPLLAETPTSNSIEDMIVLLQRKELIRKEFERLPPLRKAALYAVYIEGATQDTVAQELSIDRRLISDWKRAFEAALQRRSQEIGLND